MKELKEFKKEIENIEVTYDYEKTYCNLYNTCIDYMNDTQTWDFEYLFENIINYDTAELYAKDELNNGGLVRLYYFLGNANLNNDIFKINGYGNLENITKDDLEILKKEILDKIEELEKEEE